MLPPVLILLCITGLAHAGEAPKIERQRGPCLGGNRPSVRCKTCEHCAYCGKDKGRAGNSATCVVCSPPR